MKFHSAPVFLTLIMVLSFGFWSLGCNEDVDPVDPVVDEGPTPVVTPDQLMANFKIINEEMLSAELVDAIDEGFRFLVSPETVEEWSHGNHPIDPAFFDRDTFLVIHQNMFGGEEGGGPGGESIPIVASVNVTTMQKYGTWQPVGPEVEYFGNFPGAHSVQYNVLFHFNNPNGHRYEVDQTLIFYVLPESIDDLADWRFLGIECFSPGKSRGSDNVAYDGLLSLYR